MTSRAPDLAVRPAVAFDLDALAQLHAEAFAQAWDQPWSRESIATLLAMPGSFGLIGLIDGVPAGLVIARVAGGEAEILTLGVTPDARRRGLARLLLDETVSHAAAEGAERLFLEVAEDNLPAQSLYHGADFVRVGRRPDYYARGTGVRVAALILARPLAVLPFDAL
ncbi:ribosomal-protein-alanine N-acetyltransferase [Hypericibacter adhaerens]|jgi:ribosomal-protein-alanine N-acetyltransferase|uniref:Ribosomal-protein-alanine N-acetyltransferase n=1 Tax=Hypericibacter adhaerens TaxID=2602016 RepID=A0A5J6N8H2_9PROT|nr:GNAT family N-acetyltransferase [Hypericibacter adhaerens]QEX25290.1 ribosomal-protein-alanine N-acetyltransferase [Hypericibacter adhaerens]